MIFYPSHRNLNKKSGLWDNFLFWQKSKLCSQQVRSYYYGRISFQLGTHWCSKRTQTLLNCTNPKLIVLMSIFNSFFDWIVQIHYPWHIYLKVSKSRKQIVKSRILPKKEQNTLRILSKVRFVHFLEESKTSWFAFEIYWPLEIFWQNDKDVYSTCLWLKQNCPWYFFFNLHFGLSRSLRLKEVDG